MTRDQKPGWRPWKTWWLGGILLASPCCGVAYGMRICVWSAWQPVAWSASVAHASVSHTLSGILHDALIIGHGGQITPKNLSNPVDAAVLTLVVGAHQQLSQETQAEHLHTCQYQHHR